MRVLDIMSFPGIASCSSLCFYSGVTAFASIIFSGFMYATDCSHCLGTSIVAREYGEDYVRATIVSGAQSTMDLWKHVLRNCIAPHHGPYRYALLQTQLSLSLTV